MLKRAQAALEFLTTYGWAFLVILIVIGTLAYFGILSPSRLLPSRCTIGAEFQCMDFNIKDLGATTDELRLKLKNNVGEAINVASITLSKEDGTAYAACTTPQTPPTAWKSAEIKTLTWTGCNFDDLSGGEKGKIVVTVRYNTVASGTAFSREAKGEVYSAVLTS